MTSYPSTPQPRSKTSTKPASLWEHLVFIMDLEHFCNQPRLTHMLPVIIVLGTDIINLFLRHKSMYCLRWLTTP